MLDNLYTLIGAAAGVICAIPVLNSCFKNLRPIHVKGNPLTTWKEGGRKREYIVGKIVNKKY